MGRHYIARRGDCVHRIAAVLGVTADAIWGHPQNDALRARRASGAILKDGDVVFVPDPAPGPSLSPGGRHRFRAAPPTVPIRVRIVDPSESGPARPRAGTPFVFRAEGRSYEGTTDGDGYAEARLPATVDEAVLTLDPGAPEEHSILLRIGHLDPHTEASGVRHRLRNLGYLDHDVEPGAISAAIAAFQRAAGIEATGTADDATIAKLVDWHGS